MKRRKYSDYDAFDEYGILKDQRSVRVPMFCMDAAQTAVRQHFAQVHDGTGDNALGMHRPGFRVSGDPPSDELKLAREDYLHDLTTAWRRGVRKEVAVPGAPSTSSNQMPASDVDDVYRLYLEEVSQA
jgi:hypothetical protein